MNTMKLVPLLLGLVVNTAITVSAIPEEAYVAASKDARPLDIDSPNVSAEEKIQNAEIIKEFQEFGDEGWKGYFYRGEKRTLPIDEHLKYVHFYAEGTKPYTDLDRDDDRHEAFRWEKFENTPIPPPDDVRNYNRKQKDFNGNEVKEDRPWDETYRDMNIKMIRKSGEGTLEGGTLKCTDLESLENKYFEQDNECIIQRKDKYTGWKNIWKHSASITANKHTKGDLKERERRLRNLKGPQGLLQEKNQDRELLDQIDVELKKIERQLTHTEFLTERGASREVGVQGAMSKEITDHLGKISDFKYAATDEKEEKRKKRKKIVESDQDFQKGFHSACTF